MDERQLIEHAELLGRLSPTFALEGPINEAGFYAVKKLRAGRWLAVEPQTFSRARLGLCVDVSGCYDDVWDYASRADAIAAMDRWDGEGEPTGWIRHARSGRRRP